MPSAGFECRSSGGASGSAARWVLQSLAVAVASDCAKVTAKKAADGVDEQPVYMPRPIVSVHKTYFVRSTAYLTQEYVSADGIPVLTSAWASERKVQDYCWITDFVW